MYQEYKEINLRGETKRLVYLMNDLIKDYRAQGFKLSVRQLYYQLVARALIENTEQSYKRIASIINDARLGGFMDWDAIEDRNRDIEVRARWNSGADIVKAAASSFHMDMWVGQPTRPLVIVEKAALAGVLEGVCRRYDVPLLAARGYPSVSILREMALEHLVPAVEDGQIPYIIHMGDHDPSGIDMTRDLQERLEMFLYAETREVDLEVCRIALTMKQIQAKNPPPNPAKTTDSRFRDYRRRFGDESWELDALEPSYLVELVEKELLGQIEKPAWTARAQEIEHIREKLTRTAEAFE